MSDNLPIYLLEVQRYIKIKISINNKARPVFEAFTMSGLAGVREDNISVVKVGPPVHNYEHEAGSYGDGFT
jgi:hypothetical protein